MKAGLVGLAVLLSTLAGRRWGHRLAGWIAGLPIIAGPICAFMAYDLGADFVKQTALATLQVVPAIGVFCVTFAWVARGGSWWRSLGAAYCTYLSVAYLCQRLPIPSVLPWLQAGALWLWALAGWAGLSCLLPRIESSRSPLRIPQSELWARVAFAIVLALAIGFGAPYLGSAWSGLLLGIPISGSVLPVFTLRLHSLTATHQVLRGFLLGIFSFISFFFVLAAGLPYANALLVFVLGVGFALLSARALAWWLSAVNGQA